MARASQRPPLLGLLLWPFRWDHAWFLVVLSAALLATTCLHSQQSVLTRNLPLVNRSRAYSIFFLRALSELAGLAMAAAIAASLERLKWALVCRDMSAAENNNRYGGAASSSGAAVVVGAGYQDHHRHGSSQPRRRRRRARFLDVLALQEDATIAGLATLAAGPGVGGAGTRLLSVSRLLLMAVIPVLGVVIMSQVDISLAFAVESRQPAVAGYGMDGGGINASVAAEWSPFADLTLTGKYFRFLGDPFQSVDLTPDPGREKGCNLLWLSEHQDAAGGINATRTTTGGGAAVVEGETDPTAGCKRTYFFPGEAAFAAPPLRTSANYSTADAIILSNHNGYLFDYDVGDPHYKFDMAKDCHIYASRLLGYEFGAVLLCVATTGYNELQGRLVTCPGSIASKLQCRTDTSWWHNVDWTIKLRVSLQSATVGYSRSNGTILFSSFPSTHLPGTTSAPVPVPVSGQDILQAYDLLLFDNTALGRPNASSSPTLFSSSQLAALLWLSEPVFSADNAANPSTSLGVFSMLQSLLAMPFYYCQAGVARRVIPPILDEKDVDPAIVALVDRLSPLPANPSTRASFAYLRYEASASHATLLAYAILGAATLASCAAALLVAGWWRAEADAALSAGGGGGGGGRAAVVPRLTSFPTLDLLAHCAIEDERRHVVYQGRSSAFHDVRDGGGAQRVRWLATLSVTRASPPAAGGGGRGDFRRAAGGGGGGGEGGVDPELGVAVVADDGLDMTRSWWGFDATSPLGTRRKGSSEEALNAGLGKDGLGGREMTTYSHSYGYGYGDGVGQSPGGFEQESGKYSRGDQLNSPGGFF